MPAQAADYVWLDGSPACCSQLMKASSGMNPGMSTQQSLSAHAASSSKLKNGMLRSGQQARAFRHLARLLGDCVQHVQTYLAARGWM